MELSVLGDALVSIVIRRCRWLLEDNITTAIIFATEFFVLLMFLLFFAFIVFVNFCHVFLVFVFLVFVSLGAAFFG